MASLGEKRRILLDEILSRDEDTKIIQWPKRAGVKIGLRLLSEGEMSEADCATREWAQGVGLETGPGRHRDNEFASRYASEVLCRALIHPESRQPVVVDVDDLRKRISRMELDLLTRAYNDFAREMFADPDALTDEELVVLVEELRGPFCEDRLLRCVPGTLRALLRYTVSRLPASTGSES